MKFLDDLRGLLIKINVILLSAKPPTPTKKKGKSKTTEPESIHVISSDEDDDEKPSKVVTILKQFIFSEK